MTEVRKAEAAKQNKSQRPATLLFSFLVRKSSTAGTAKKANVNLVKMPRAQTNPSKMLEIHPDDSTRTRTRSNDNHIVSSPLVKGRQMITQAGQEVAMIHIAGVGVLET
jgi:hypothetical protein